MQSEFNAKTQRRKDAKRTTSLILQPFVFATLQCNPGMSFLSEKISQGNDWQRNKKMPLQSHSSDNHSPDISGAAQKEDGRQKNGGKKMKTEDFFAPIFLPFLLRVLLFKFRLRMTALSLLPRKLSGLHIEILLSCFIFAAKGPVPCP